eukprot:1848819-Lingulodinium_polyedra.AAC.1
MQITTVGDTGQNLLTNNAARPNLTWACADRRLPEGKRLNPKYDGLQRARSDWGQTPAGQT